MIDGPNIARYMNRVARELLGTPNEHLSKLDKELRYGTNGSLKIDLVKGVFKDFETDEKGGVLALIEREKGLTGKAAFEFLRQIGCDAGAAPASRPANGATTSAPPPRRLVATFNYHDADGELSFQVLRYEPKTFKQRRPKLFDAKGGWDWVGGPPLPYRLPQLIEAIANERTIFIVEGEGKVDALAKWNVPATCNAGGAKKWKPEHTRHLAGADVILLPDNDEPGRNHIDVVGAALKNVAIKVRLLQLPGLGPKGDIVNWIKAGGTAEQLWALAEQAPPWAPHVKPPDAPPPPIEVNGADVEPPPITDIPDHADNKRDNTPITLPAAKAHDEQQQNGRDGGEPPADMSADSEHEDRPPTYSDEALALSFAELHADDLRYVAAWNRWMIWDGTRWRFDETMEAYSLVRKVCRAAAADCNKAKLASALASAKTVAAVASLARSDRRLAATTSQWDTDLWLLNTPGGVVDLRTGKRRPTRPTDYMTKITTATPDGNAATTVWLTFLKRITGDNGDFIAFMQRIAGYALTGSTREEALFFLYGIGANGKSTFLNAITGIIGDYHTVAPIETFTASMQEHHPTDLAGLRGARLVTSVETEEGRRWAEAKIKALTGGDKISARFMRQDNFEYVPTFKLMIAGNHKPGLRSVDEAIRRRFHLLPFDVTIPLQERDGHLGDRLRQEWPGILQWMIEGCLAWQKRGLDPPATVRAATSAYLEAEDAFAAWLDETGKRDPDAWESTKTLFASWKAWTEQTGEYTGTMKRFVQNLEDRGLTLERRNYARGLRGFRIGLNLNGGP